MRFIVMIKGDRNYEAGRPPDPRLYAAMGTFSEEMTRNGTLLSSEGLLPSAKGALLQVAGGEITVIDGPFTEAKELVGGYAIVRAASKAEAIELARQFMQIHVDVYGSSWEGECEVRQLSDFEPG